jgi:hypothetical protein
MGEQRPSKQRNVKTEDDMLTADDGDGDDDEIE